MSDVDLVTLTEQHTATIRERVPMAELPTFFRRAFQAVLETLSAEGIQPSGPPFCVYHGIPTDSVDAEAGFPVERPVEGADAVQPSSLPGGRAVEAMHLGPYESLPRTYESLRTHLEREGLQPAAEMWESYLTGPEDGLSETWRTRVVMPLR